MEFYESNLSKEILLERFTSKLMQEEGSARKTVDRINFVGNINNEIVTLQLTNNPLNQVTANIQFEQSVKGTTNIDITYSKPAFLKEILFLTIGGLALAIPQKQYVLVALLIPFMYMLRLYIHRLAQKELYRLILETIEA